MDDEIIAVDGVDTRYMLVVNDDNFTKLEPFLDSHREFTFDIVRATYDNRGDGVELSDSNRNTIAMRFFNRITRESFDRLFREKRWEDMKFI